jgi:hypothetical protein
MKAKILPDWFAPLFAWVITIVVLGAAITQPEGVYVNRSMLWFPPLLAVAWTSGFVGMLRFKKKFKEEHEALGSPQLFGSPYEGRHWKFLGYLLSFRFLRLGDPVVSACFSVFSGLTIAGLIGFLSLLGKS